MAKKRIVVTGIGAVTPLGNGVKPTWENMLAGKSGISRITHFDPTEFASQIAGQVPGADEPNGLNVDDYISPKDQKKMGRFIHLGLAACDEAVKMAGLNDIDEVTALRAGVLLGSGIGGLPEIESAHATLQERGPRRVSPFFIPAILINLLPGQASIRYGFKGPNVSAVTACASGAHSIGEAMKIIQRGEADIMLAGGAESCISPMAVAGFAAAKALSSGYNDTPEKACRPFDSARDGFVIAEGAGVLVIETEESANKRGATILAELAGFGESGDAYHITSPVESGEGGQRAMRMALADAEMASSEIGYVNAHATSTPAGDDIESRAIQGLFGDKILVSSTKSMTGHALGAAGGIEAVVSVMALQDQILPPTINLENASEDCRLDCIANVLRKVDGLNAVLSNSFGFGGTNASLIFKKQ